MDQRFNYFEDIVAGRTSWKLRVRVIRLWTLPEPKTRQQLGSIDMILVDEKFAKIQATVGRQWVSRFMDVVHEGESYILENVMVGRNDRLFPKTCHRFRLNFLGTTIVTPTTVDQLPWHVFDFLDFPNILEAKKTDIFIDVIGHVVEKNNIREKVINGKKTSLLDLVLEDLAQHRIRCALWGGCADEMQDVLETASPLAPVILVIQMCRLTKYQGVGNISSAWHATKLYINEDIPPILDYRSRMALDENLLSQTVTQMSGKNSISISDELMLTPRMSISDLVEATEPCLGCVLVDAVEFDMSEGWAFNSCNTCFRNANKVGADFTCNHCDTLVSATPRYKLNVVVIDDTGSTTFTLFNGLVAMIVGRSAVDLISSYAQHTALGDQPIEFAPMLGKKYLFKVEVSKGNIEKGFTTYTARKFTSDSALIQRFIQKHAMNVCSEEDEVEITHTLHKLLPQPHVIDLGDSSSTDKTDDFLADFETTPTSRQLGKRPIADFQGIDLNNMDFSPDVVKKPTPTTVKIEPKE